MTPVGLGKFEGNKPSTFETVNFLINSFKLFRFVYYFAKFYICSTFFNGNYLSDQRLFGREGTGPGFRKNTSRRLNAKSLRIK